MKGEKAGTNYEGMQAANRSLILKLLSKKNPCTRAELSRATGLTQASISKIIGDMIEAGIVVENGMVPGNMGRRSVGISLNVDLCKVLAVKIARRSFDVAAFQLCGDLVEKSHKVVGINGTSPRSVMEEIKTQIRMYLQRYPDIMAIGVAVPGPYLRKEGRIAIMSEFYGWHEINIYKELQAEFTVPICIEHDANASAFAEWSANPEYYHDDQKTLVSFLASEGIGAGIVSDGRIIRGVDGVAGEVGHMSIAMDGPKCVCGNRGCLELYCSAISFAKFVEEDLMTHPESTLNRERTITAETVFAHMRQGDKFSKEEVRKVGRYIGCGMANIVYLYNPNEIIMTDIMTGGGDVLLSAAIEEVRKRTMSVLNKHLTIRITTLQYDAILMGAAALATHMLFDTPDVLYKVTPEKENG